MKKARLKTYPELIIDKSWAYKTASLANSIVNDESKSIAINKTNGTAIKLVNGIWQ